ncbi:MAG: AfsR/DnrI/RedD family transcriptional regulator, partial [Deinococcus sp.]|nr:AfsR/DnrI/RedD family transcriptional regulator [Deinococcus sp.]
TQGRLPEVLALDGELLENLSYDDCPDLADWVTAERERLLEWRAHARRHEAARLEGAGDYEAALTQARALLDLDPVSEDANRRLMRLHYLRGDRPAALKTYRRCQEVLRREFGTDPLPETAHLAREIDRGTVPVGPAPSKPELPLAVLRPPHLMGREREWAQMERAWEAGQWIYITGEPGSGKTRLALDFAASKGEYIVFSGRPGDRVQPYTTLTRMARHNTQRRPELMAQMEPWVRLEMARLLPELAPPGETPPPIRGEEDLLRFRQAHMIWSIAAHEDLVSNLCDDWQFYDDSTNQMGVFMFGTSFPLGQPGGMPRILVTYRRGELPPESQAVVHNGLDTGIAVLIDLKPLDDVAMNALMNEIDLPTNPEVRARLWRHCGGNPHFLLETVKHLIESGQLGERLPERLPLPEKVWALIGRRLERLSGPALQAARAAAVLQSDFDPEQVAELLGAPLLDLLGAWEELEAAQVVQGHRFTHDLVYEAVLAGIPASLRGLLHRAAARTLERSGAGAARVAEHWQQGGKPEAALPFLQRAAREAQDQYRLEEAASFHGEAAEVLKALGDGAAAARAVGAQTALLALVPERLTPQF